MPDVLNTKEHHCDYTDIFSFSQVTHIHFYSKGMIVILDTIEDQEVGWGNENFCAQAVKKYTLIIHCKGS